MPFNSYGAINLLNLGASLDVVYNERERDISAVSQLETGKVQGRWRNTGASARAIPTSDSDILSGDTDGDLLFDSNYLYIFLTFSGTKKWCRIALDSSW